MACIALFVGALILVATDSTFGMVGLLVLVASVLAGLGFGFLWSNTPGSVGGYLDSTARWVELAPVSARFAAAYEDQEAARKAVRQYER